MAKAYGAFAGLSFLYGMILIAETWQGWIVLMLGFLPAACSVVATRLLWKPAQGAARGLGIGLISLFFWWLIFSTYAFVRASRLDAAGGPFGNIYPDFARRIWEGIGFNAPTLGGLVAYALAGYLLSRQTPAK